jgi:hypothetical protein
VKGRRLIGFATLLLLVLAAAVPAAANGDWSPQATASMTLADPPWCYPGSCNLLADDYPDVVADPTYDMYGETFEGSLVASGMIPNMQYQIKLEGKPTCKDPAGDDDDNMAIGSIGRWWDDTAGSNLTDGEVAAAVAAGHCVLGYVIFDCATADGDGNLNLDFALDHSYHVCGVDERGPVTLPPGDYNVSFAITENPAWWRTVLVGDVNFSVGEWLDFVDVGSGDGYEDSNPNRMKHFSLDVCPTETGGNYGGIATDPNSPDKECRTVWANDDPNRSYGLLKLWIYREKPEKLIIRALDGIADDSFVVEVWPNRRGPGEEIYAYTADPSTEETWVIHEIPLPEGADYDLKGLSVRIKATGAKWEHFDTYGQLAVDWIGVWK